MFFFGYRWRRFRHSPTTFHVHNTFLIAHDSSYQKGKVMKHTLWLDHLVHLHTANVELCDKTQSFLPLLCSVPVRLPLIPLHLESDSLLYRGSDVLQKMLIDAKAVVNRDCFCCRFWNSETNVLFSIESSSHTWLMLWRTKASLLPLSISYNKQCLLCSFLVSIWPTQYALHLESPVHTHCQLLLYCIPILAHRAQSLLFKHSLWMTFYKNVKLLHASNIINDTPYEFRDGKVWWKVKEVKGTLFTGIASKSNSSSSFFFFQRI